MQVHINTAHLQRDSSNINSVGIITGLCVHCKNFTPTPCKSRKSCFYLNVGASCGYVSKKVTKQNANQCVSIHHSYANTAYVTRLHNLESVSNFGETLVFHYCFTPKTAFKLKIASTCFKKYKYTLL